MAPEKDVKLGDNADVKVSQATGVLTLEANIKSPISIGGTEFGAVEGKVDVTIQESAIIDAFEKKYPNPAVVAALEMLKKGIALV